MTFMCQRMVTCVINCFRKEKNQATSFPHPSISVFHLPPSPFFYGLRSKKGCYKYLNREENRKGFPCFLSLLIKSFTSSCYTHFQTLFNPTSQFLVPNVKNVTYAGNHHLIKWSKRVYTKLQTNVEKIVHIINYHIIIPLLFKRK